MDETLVLHVYLPCCRHASTVKIVHGVTARYPNIIPSHFIQGTPGVLQTNHRLQKGLTFVHARWLQASLKQTYAVRAVLIPPGVDTSLSYASPAAIRDMTAPKGPLRICASLRLERSRLSLTRAGNSRRAAQP